MKVSESPKESIHLPLLGQFEEIGRLFTQNIRPHWYLVQFEVEAASVAHRFPLVVPPPEGGRRRVAVGALQARATAGTLERFASLL